MSGIAVDRRGRRRAGLGPAIPATRGQGAQTSLATFTVALLAMLAALPLLTVAASGQPTEGRPLEIFLPPPRTSAVPDRAEGRAGGSIEINVLANDVISRARSNVAIEMVQPPSQGTAQIIGNNIVYRSNENAYGQDSLKYRIKDADYRSNETTVSIALHPYILAVDDSPDLARGPQYVINVLDNDQIPARPPVRITIKSPPGDGQATVAADGRSVTYVPAREDVARDSFQYSIVDAQSGELYGSAQVTVVIPPLPPLRARDDQLQVRYGTSGEINVADNDVYPPGLPLQVKIVAGAVETAGVAGTVVRVTPPRGEIAAFSLQYVLESGALRSQPATLSVVIDPGIRLEPRSVLLEPNEAREIEVISDDTPQLSELIPSKLHLAILRPPEAGTAIEARDGRSIRYRAGPTPINDLRIPVGLVPTGGSAPGAETVVIVTVRERLPTPDCADTNVPGGLFLVREGVYQVPKDDWAQPLFQAFGVANTLEVDKPFCIARREIRRVDLSEFARTGGATADKAVWQQEDNPVLNDETEKMPEPLANMMSHQYSQNYADWLNGREKGGVLRLPSAMQWLAAIIVASTDPQHRSDVGMLATFRAGVREWSRQPCNLPDSEMPKFETLGQSTLTFRYGQSDSPKMCRPADLLYRDVGFRLVKEMNSSAETQSRSQQR
ncbi:MAG: hypothetical protein GC191_03160 [Azospirillum sp.]|nr:hypothetical protein [Azospirillum sp.]